MNLSLFTDLIEALGKVAGALKALKDLPRSDRERYRQVLDDTLQLVHTTINMVILRLGDILQSPDDNAFLLEVCRLDNYDEWIEAERKFRLCRSLRVAVSETEGLAATWRGRISTNDWDTLLEQMRAILCSEGELADFIGGRFGELALRAQDAHEGTQAARDVRTDVETTRDALKQERQQLILQEVALLDSI